jgi:uncharacterized membrane protein
MDSNEYGDIGGWAWLVIDVAFVTVLAIAMAWVHIARRRSNGKLVPASRETLKPDPDTRRTGRYGRWQDWANLALGLWLCVSPSVLWRGDVPPESLTANAVIVGVLLAMLALAALYRLEAPAEWAVIVAAAWIFLSPWLYGFSHLRVAAWDHWIVGALVAILSGWELLTLRNMPALPTDPRTAPAVDARRE